MGLGSIIIYLVLVISLFSFIYFLVKSARTWGVLHSILHSILFIECWVFLVFAAGVHEYRLRYTEMAHKAKVNAQKETERTTQLLYGSFQFSATEIDAVVPAKGMLRRMTIDRGRVWRQLTYVQQDKAAGTYQLEYTAPQADPELAAADEAVAEATPGPDEQITTDLSLPANLVVYVFAEKFNEEGKPMPAFYLGEFVVASSQGGKVTLKPTLNLKDFQTAYIASGVSSTWSLYEMLPIDSHDAFAAPGSEPTDEAIFGRMDESIIRSLFSEVTEENNMRAQVIESYLRDGQRATDNDSRNVVWQQVEVLDSFTFQVDSGDDANATVGGYFDSTGRAVDVRLKRSNAEEGVTGDVNLTPDNNNKRIVLKDEVARELRDAGKVKLIQPIFVRPLIDYEEAFNRSYIRKHELQERIALVERETDLITQTNSAGEQMLTFRQVELEKLQSDLNGFKREIEILNQATTDATAAVQSLKAEMSRMYRAIQDHYSVGGSTTAAIGS